MNEENKDLVTIPKYIADEIESHSDNPSSASIVSSIVNLYIQNMYNDNIDSWLMNIKNHDILLQAIVHGYIVENPTLYYVIVLKGDKYSYLNKNFNNGIVDLSDYYQTDAYQTQFTEDEIKAIDPAYFNDSFLEKVEEN